MQFIQSAVHQTDRIERTLKDPIKEHSQESHRNVNIKSMDSWLLVICMVVGRLTAPTEGALLKWVKLNDGSLQLQNIPTRGQAEYTVKLYQHFEEREKSLFMESFTSSDDENDATFGIKQDDARLEWEGDSKIVRATVSYPDGGFLVRSKAVNLCDGKEVDHSVGELKFEETVEVIVESGADWWEFKLLDIPSRGGVSSCMARLYQQREEDKWFPVWNEARSFNALGKNNISFSIPDSIFRGSSRIIMVEVIYKDFEKVVGTAESKSFDLKQALAEMANRRKDVGVIVGCVIGGVCIIALVVGGVLYCRKRSGRVP